jgi:hypothetical protein
MLSECARKYARVLEDPFSGGVACVPTLTNFPTMKHSFRTRGTVTTSSTSGMGFVTMNPYFMLFNDTNALYQSNSTYTGSVISTGVATGITAAGSNSPYTSIQNGTQVKGRLVAAGLRVRNVTALLSRGGSLAAAESLNHTSLDTLNYTNLLLMDTAGTLDASLGSWQSVVWHPQDEDELDFIQNTDTGAPPFNAYTLGFIMTAPTVATVQNYEWEAYAVFEAKGQLVHGLTPSLSDPQGLAAVQNAVMPVENRKPTSLNTAWKAAQSIYRAVKFIAGVYATYRTGNPSYAIAGASRPQIEAGQGPIIEEIE